MLLYKLIIFMSALTIFSSCTNKQFSIDTNNKNDEPISIKKPTINSLSSREPNSGGSNLYINVTGRNLGGDGWQTQLKNDSSVVDLITESISNTTAKFLIPATEKIISGTYSLFISNAYGESSADTEINPSIVTKQQVEIIRDCISRDYEQLTGFVQKNNAYYLMPGILNEAIKSLSVPLAAADYTIENSVGAVGASFGISKVKNARTKRTANLDGFEVIKSRMAEKANVDHLVDYQRACMAQCVASKIISYDHGLALSMSPSCAIGNGKGVCREYSWIASDLMRYLGLRAQRQTVIAYWTPEENPTRKSSGPHVVTKVNIGGSDFLMEPQKNDCIFYERSFNMNASSKPTKIFSIEKPRTDQNADSELFVK